MDHERGGVGGEELNIRDHERGGGEDLCSLTDLVAIIEVSLFQFNYY